MAARRPVDRGLGAADNRLGRHRDIMDSQLLHAADRHALDLLLLYQHRCRGDWRRFCFLREAALVSAATLFHIRAASLAGTTPPFLSLGLRLRIAWVSGTRMFAVVQTLKRPNQPPGVNSRHASRGGSGSGRVAAILRAEL